jgi:hypothetical protein
VFYAPGHAVHRRGPYYEARSTITSMVMPCAAWGDPCVTTSFSPQGRRSGPKIRLLSCDSFRTVRGAPHGEDPGHPQEARSRGCARGDLIEARLVGCRARGCGSSGSGTSRH